MNIIEKAVVELTEEEAKAIYHFIGTTSKSERTSCGLTEKDDETLSKLYNNLDDYFDA